MASADDQDSGAKALRPASARYRKVPVATYDDPAFRALSPIPPCGRGLFLYLRTGPHTGAIPGLFRAGRAGLAEELEWDVEAFDEAMGEVISQGLAKADFKAKVVWLPGEFRHNRPESLNVVKNWASAASLVPECDLKREAIGALKAGLRTMGEAFAKAWDEASAEPSAKPSQKPSAKASPKARAIQEQQQQQQQEQQSTSMPDGTGAAALAPGHQADQLPGFEPGKTAEPSAKAQIFDSGVSLLCGKGMSEDAARRYLASLCKGSRDKDVLEAVLETIAAEPLDPKSKLKSILQRKRSEDFSAKQYQEEEHG